MPNSIEALHEENNKYIIYRNMDCEIDYYKILGLNKECAIQDINSAHKTYIQLALMFHPDKNIGNINANNVMAEINNAFDIVKYFTKNKQASITDRQYIEKLCSENSFLREIDQKYTNFQNFFEEFKQINSSNDLQSSNDVNIDLSGNLHTNTTTTE